MSLLEGGCWLPSSSRESELPGGAPSPPPAAAACHRRRHSVRDWEAFLSCSYSFSAVVACSSDMVALFSAVLLCCCGEHRRNIG